ncbi:hypothetical protein [Tenacibaculum singaporense]|uniref:Uncharacterized protein n=1 Tax=Tenacibaculum singaporense TaxID=2358479 RepID=A0A3Q8RR48_9FLAO|nr:hypothetical protein [Tenacibaculum singaporense]AZJ34870.1 hypothetical protein D6T69_04755 [Tenacibaculum singaporense]
MIKTKITSNFPHHIITTKDDDIHIADYTESTKNLPAHLRRSVEIFSPTPPTDNNYFTIKNSSKLDLDNIIFDHSSFVRSNGSTLSQCESCSFPSVSNSDSWILFLELKYSNNPNRNKQNLKKAIKQLVKTRGYYSTNSTFLTSNNCYLIASLPLQTEPFANFALTQDLISRIKIKYNFILRLKNSVEVLDKSILLV